MKYGVTVKNFMMTPENKVIAKRVKKRHEEGFGVVTIAKNFRLSHTVVLKIVKEQLWID